MYIFIPLPKIIVSMVTKDSRLREFMREGPRTFESAFYCTFGISRSLDVYMYHARVFEGVPPGTVNENRPGYSMYIRSPLLT